MSPRRMSTQSSSNATDEVVRRSSIASANNQDGSAQPLTNLRINVEEPSLAAHISHHSSAQTQHAHSSSHPPAHSIINDEASESSTADATSTSSYLDHTSQTHASVEPSSSQPPAHTPSESALITALSLGLTTSLSTEALLTTIARLQTENQNLQGQNNVMRDQICQMGGHLVALGSIVSQRGSTIGSSSVGSFTGRSFLDGGGPNAIFVGLGGRQKSGEDPAEGLNKARSKKRRSCGSNLTNSARSNATSGDTKGGINRFGYTNFRDYDGNNHMGSILSVDDSRHANDDDNADAENDEVDYLEDNENLKNQTQHKGLGDDHIEIEEDGDDDGGCEGDGDIESSFETGPSIANKFVGGARNDGGILDKEKYPATRINRTSPRIHSEPISNDVIQEDEKSESAAEDDQDIIDIPVPKIPIAQDIDMSFTEINAIIAEKYGEHNVPEAKNIYRPASVCGPAATDVGSKNTITSGKTVVSGGSDGDASADVNSALECAAASHKSPQNIHHQEHDVLKHTLAVHRQQKHDSHKQRHERSTADEDLPCTHEEAAIKSSYTPIKKSRLKKIDHPQIHMKDEKQHQHQHPQLHTKALDSSISILDFEDLHISSNSLSDKNQHHHQGDHIQYNGLKASTSQLEITLVSQNDVLCDSEKVPSTTINQSLLSNASSNQSSVSLNLETFSEGDEDEEDDSAVPEDASESEIDLFLEKRFSIYTGRPRNGRRRRSDQSNGEKSASASVEEKCGLSTKTNEGGGVIKSASRNSEKSDVPTSVGGNDTNDEENSRRKGRSERQSNNTEKRPQFTELKVSAENIDEVREEPDAFDTSTRLSSKISTDSMRRIRSIDGSKAEGAGDSNNGVSFALGKRKTNRYVSLHQKSFMKNPFANSFALPRANPTKKLDERHNDSMLSLQSKDDDGEKYKSDNIQMMKILTSMSMILTKQSLVKAVMSHQPMNQQTPFQLFFLLSMNVKAAKKQLESCPLDDGRNFLDPFNCKLADCVDRYPSKLGKDALEPTELSAFCCPEGIKVRLIPRAGVAGAKHMGWMGKRACQYKLLVFTNENGDTTHGIAITICEEVSVGSDDMGEIMDHLLNLRKRRICARKICRWWKRSVRNRRASMTGQSHRRFSRRSIYLEEDVSSRPGKMKRRKSWNAITCIFNSSSSISAMSGMFDDDDSSDESSQCSKNSEKVQGKRNLKSSFNSKTAKETSGSFTSQSVSRSVAGLLNRKRLDRSNTDLRGRSSSKPIVDVPDTNSDGNSVESGFLDWNGLTHFSEEEEEDGVLDVDFPNREEETKPKKAKVLAREAFRAMNAASAEGDICVVEKCYVMIGGNQSEQFLHLRLLQNMIDKEQEENMNPTMPVKGLGSGVKSKRDSLGKSMKLPTMLRHVGRDSGNNTDNKLLNFRHAYLQVLQEKMMLSPEQSRVQRPHSKTDKRRSRPAKFELVLPTFTLDTYKFSTALPLPHVAGHWGVASLITRIKSKDLLLILKLLLVERSVLVIGESSHLVSSCACALLELLKPYDWASNFMPLLPCGMLDFVNSPVPFLIGMTVKNHKHGREIEDDERVVEAMRTGLSVVNLSSNAVRLTTETEIVEIIQGCPTPKTQLLVYQNRLELLKKQSSPLRSFARFIKQGLSRNEIDTINSIQHLIQTYLKGLADNIATNPYGWKFYGKNDEKGEAFDFYPSLFVDRLKQQMKLLECRLQFQEMMAYSQLFVEFVDGQRKASLSKEVVGKLIANWIYQQWKLKKMLKNNKSSRSIKNH